MPDTENWIFDCLSMLQFMQGGQEWSRGMVNVYTLVLNALGEEWSRKSVEFAVLNEKWRPAPAELRHIAARLASPFPPVDDAYAEMMGKAESCGIYGRPDPGNANCFLEGPPPFSHPLIEQAIRACSGWRMICSGEAQMQEGLSKQFRGAYTRAADAWISEVANVLALPAKDRPARLFPKPKLPTLPAPRRKAAAALPSAAAGITRSDLPPIAPPEIREKLNAAGVVIGRSMDSTPATEEQSAKLNDVRAELEEKRRAGKSQLCETTARNGVEK